MIRSTTDEMLAARHDPEPWIVSDGVSEWRSSVAWRDGYTAVGASSFEFKFAPRVECVPSRDSLPWVWHGPSGITYGRSRGPYVALPDDPPGWTSRFEPNAEYTRPEPNPILVAFRLDVDLQHDAQWLSTHSVAQLWLDRNEGAEDATPAQIEDARKVLTRLVGVFG